MYVCGMCRICVWFMCMYSVHGHMCLWYVVHVCVCVHMWDVFMCECVLHLPRKSLIQAYSSHQALPSCMASAGPGI